MFEGSSLGPLALIIRMHEDEHANGHKARARPHDILRLREPRAPASLRPTAFAVRFYRLQLAASHLPVRSAKHIDGLHLARLMWLLRVDRNVRSKPQLWRASSRPAFFSLPLLGRLPIGHLTGRGEALLWGTFQLIITAYVSWIWKRGRL